MGLELGSKNGVVVASSNVYGLPSHIEVILKDKGIHLLAPNETKVDENCKDEIP